MSNEGIQEISGLRTRVIVSVLHRLFAFTRGMTLGVRAACFDEQGRIFLVRHTYVPGWYLPGGGVEHGETVAVRLRRNCVRKAIWISMASRISFRSIRTVAPASATT